MKCPFILLLWQAKEDRKDYDLGDCLKEECAWWMPAFQVCSIFEIAVRLGSVADNVFSIMDKMPPHIPKH